MAAREGDRDYVASLMDKGWESYLEFLRVLAHSPFAADGRAVVMCDQASAEMALKSLERAANAGINMAQYQFGQTILIGECSSILPKHVSEGVAWLERAAVVRPPEDAQFVRKIVLHFLGPSRSHFPNDHTTGLVISAQAMSLLGEHYSKPGECARRCLAVSWYEKSIPTYELALKRRGDGNELLDFAEKNLKRDVEALSVVYDNHFCGRARNPGFELDPSKATACYGKGAQLGIPFCQNMFGDAYLQGLGVQRDVNEGMKWLTRAAESGNVDAAISLAFIHFTR